LPVSVGRHAVGDDEATDVGLDGSPEQVGASRESSHAAWSRADVVPRSGRSTWTLPIRSATTVVVDVVATHDPTASAHAFVAP
jgi:hypothetical protein